MYRATTRNIEITANPTFLEDQSRPENGRFVWAYTITIFNNGAEPVQLLTRHWVITDGNGARQEVKGPGVIGEQPRISPNDSYTYSSGCPLATERCAQEEPQLRDTGPPRQARDPERVELVPGLGDESRLDPVRRAGEADAHAAGAERFGDRERRPDVAGCPAGCDHAPELRARGHHCDRC